MTGTDRIPEITPEGRLRTNWQTVCGVASVLIAAAVWGTVLYSDVQTLKAQAIETQRLLDSLSRQVDRLNWTINPAPTASTTPHHGVQP